MLTRRQFVATTAAASLVSRTAFAATRADVIVIGGGLSGLNAALLLQEQGLKPIVLEAGTQVGGRVRSHHTVDGPVDVGASQIGRGYARVLDACRRFGLRLIPEDRDLLTFGANYQGNWIDNRTWESNPLNRTVGDERHVPPFMMGSRLASKYNPLKELDDWLNPTFSAYDISLRQLLQQHQHSEQAIEFASYSAPGIGIDGTSMLRMWQEETRNALERRIGEAATSAERNHPFGEANSRTLVDGLTSISNIDGGCQLLPLAMAARLGDAVRLNKKVGRVEMTDSATDGTSLAANERLVQVSQITTPASTGVGAYDFTANPYLSGDPIYGQTFSSYTDAQTKTTSVFAALGYDFGGLRVNAEGRYNVDRKRAQVNSVSNPLSQPGVNLPIDGTHVPLDGYFPVTGATYKRKFTSFTPRFTVDYKVTPDVFLFASAAKGVRSGGFNTGNPVSSTGILADEVSYDEEENWTYELGIKSEWLDRRLLINASVFHVDWSNAQVSAFTQNPTAVNPVRIVRNAGNIKTDGFELMSEFRATDIFSFGGSLVYSNPKFKAGAYDGSIVSQCVIGSGETATAAPGCPDIMLVTLPNGTVRAVPSLEGKRPARSVKLQWNLHATADVPLNDDWRLLGRVDVSYTGPTYYNLINTGKFGERTLTNLRVALESDRYSVALWVNNLFDVAYVANTIAQPRSGIPFVFSVPEIYLGESRRVGLTAGVKF